MFLSDVDMESAINEGSLIVTPRTKVGPTSIDLHLDSIDEAKIWDTNKYAQHAKEHGYAEGEAMIARWKYGSMSREYLKCPPSEKDAVEDDLVIRRDDCIVVKPLGFLLWQTKEVVGTPKNYPKHILFVNGKSTRARTGLLVHMTAPTIHGGWNGNVTFELSNLGPFHIVLYEDDVIAQITVADLKTSPNGSMDSIGSATQGQTSVVGGPTPK